MIGYWFAVLIVAPGGPPYSTKLQYSDGRVEIVQTPVEYDVGTIVRAALIVTGKQLKIGRAHV